MVVSAAQGQIEPLVQHDVAGEEAADVVDRAVDVAFPAQAVGGEGVVLDAHHERIADDVVGGGALRDVAPVERDHARVVALHVARPAVAVADADHVVEGQMTPERIELVDVAGAPLDHIRAEPGGKAVADEPLVIEPVEEALELQDAVVGEALVQRQVGGRDPGFREVVARDVDGAPAELGGPHIAVEGEAWVCGVGEAVVGGIEAGAGRSVDIGVAGIADGVVWRQVRAPS